ncbi:MAG: DUF4013 domain-containing protein [Nanoarchaeota archaeon]|nr:DUF4013 domain-containing protein [Nanoarchaeota archaeon]
MNFIDAIKRPVQDIKTLIIGIIIMIIPIVSFIGIGYFLECARTTLKRNNKLPEFKDWTNLFVKGLIAAIIGIIYAIPVMIVLVLTVGTTVLAGGLSAMQGTALINALATLGMGMILTLIVAAVVSLLSSVAMIRYAEKGKFGAAFELSAICKKAFTGKYFAAWFVSMLYAVFIVVVLSFIPVIGTTIGAFLAGVTVYTYLADAYKGA